MLARLEDQVRMHDDLDSRLDAIAEALDARGADEEAETLAAERIRSGAAERAQHGSEALAELGIHTRRVMSEEHGCEVPVTVAEGYAPTWRVSSRT
jgi:hypothetical protein